MADRCSRVASALNFLTGEGISYYPDGCEHSALEALIQEYFNNGSSDDRIDDSTDKSDHNTEGLTITWLNHILLLYKHTDDPETSLEATVMNASQDECSGNAIYLK